MCLLCLISLHLKSQELEPRAYAALPVKTNALAVVYGVANGNVLTDPSQPIQDAELHSHNIAVGYVRTFGLANKLARVQIVTPLAFTKGTADYLGKDTSITRSGFGDTRIRFGINLIGAPALERKDFKTYQQNAIIGFSIVASIPTGLYYADKLFNLGSNRWGFKPEIGVSRRFKHVYAEAYAGVWFYTNNTKYLSVKTQKQEPVFSLQAHFSYYFKNQMWVGVNGNWFSGGETFVDNTVSGNLANNWRMGATLSMPVAKQHSLKFQFHVGAFTNTGYDYNVVSMAYQYVFF